MEFLGTALGKTLISIGGALVAALVLYFKGRSDGKVKAEKVVLENDVKAHELVAKKMKEDNEKINSTTSLFERIRLRRKR